MLAYFIRIFVKFNSSKMGKICTVQLQNALILIVALHETLLFQSQISNHLWSHEVICSTSDQKFQKKDVYVTCIKSGRPGKITAQDSNTVKRIEVKFPTSPSVNFEPVFSKVIFSISTIAIQLLCWRRLAQSFYRNLRETEPMFFLWHCYLVLQYCDVSHFISIDVNIFPSYFFCRCLNK